MQYLRGGKQTTKETPQPPSPFELATGFIKGRPGPERMAREAMIVMEKWKLIWTTLFRFLCSLNS